MNSSEPSPVSTTLKPCSCTRRDSRNIGAGPVRSSGVSQCQITSDRKSTRLNSSHANISYAVFCLKKKKIHSNISLTTLMLTRLTSLYVFFFFNDTATTEIYTLSLHDALPISHSRP